METTYKMKITCNGDFMYIMEVIYNGNYIWKTKFPTSSLPSYSSLLFSPKTPHNKRSISHSFLHHPL